VASGAAKREAKAAADARKQRDEALALAYRARWNETRVLLLARPAGWRGRALDNLKALAALDTPERDLAALRAEAAQCLVEPDLHEVPFRADHSAHGLAFSPDGTALAGAGLRALALWDVATGAARPLPAGPPPRNVSAVAFHPAGTCVAVAGASAPLRFLGTLPDGTPCPKPPVAGAQFVAFDRAGRLLVTSNTDRTVTVHEFPGGRLLRKVPIHLRGEQAVALRPDGEAVAVVGPSGNIQVHDIAMGGVTSAPQQPQGLILGLVYAPDGSSLAAGYGDGRVVLWRAAAPGRPDFEPPAVLIGHEGMVRHLAFTGDGRYLVTAGHDRTVRLWDVQTGRPRVTLSLEDLEPSALACHPDGRTLAVALSNREGRPVRLYRVESWDGRQALRPADLVGAFAAHPGRPLVAAASRQSHETLLWDLPGNNAVRRWRPEGTVVAQAFAAGGDSLAAVQLLPAGGGVRPSYSLSFWDPATGGLLRKVPLGQGVTSGVLALSPDGKHAAVAADSSTVILLGADGKEVWRNATPLSPVRRLAFLGRGERLLVCHSRGTVVILQTAGGKALHRRGTMNTATAFVVAEEAGLVVVGGVDGTLACLGLPGLEERGTLPGGPPRQVAALAARPDGRLLVSCHRDGSVLLWDLKARRVALNLPRHPDGGDHAVFTHDGRYLVIASLRVPPVVYDLTSLGTALDRLGLDGLP
jgi:WD40 repeat protein